jgi:hypothetical protein
MPVTAMALPQDGNLLSGENKRESKLLSGKKESLKWPRPHYACQKMKEAVWSLVEKAKPSPPCGWLKPFKISRTPSWKL